MRLYGLILQVHQQFVVIFRGSMIPCFDIPRPKNGRSMLTLYEYRMLSPVWSELSILPMPRR